MPRISLRIAIIVFAVFTVILTGLAVHIPWTIASRNNVTDLANQISAEIARGVSGEMDTMFASARAAQDTIGNLLREGAFDIEDKTARNQVFLSFLLSNSNFSWVSYGKPNGDFYGAQRRDEANLRLVSSRWDEKAKTATRSEQFLVNDGERMVATITQNRTNDYNSTTRSWYKLAIASPGTHVWTDVYVFSVSGRPGVNAALADKNGKDLRGVISIAIELEQVSHYLRKIKSTRSGVAFVMDSNARMIAFKDDSEISRPSANPDQPELLQIKQTTNPLLRRAHAALVHEGIDLKTLVTSKNFTYVDPKDGESYFVSITKASQKDWFVVTVIPEADFMAEVQKNSTKVVLAVAAALLLVCLIAIVTSRTLFVTPLRRIVEQTKLIAEFKLDHVRPISSKIIEIEALSSSIQNMSGGLRSFGRYLPSDLVQRLLKQGLVAELGGSRRSLTIMFMDLEGFSALSERLGHRIVPLLGDYLGAMSRLIVGRHGTIDKFIGDAIMAFWGAPVENEDQALDACRAALACIQAMRDSTLNHDGKLRIRIGINSGRVVVGNIGATDRLNYTVIGDPVNLASRVEGLSKAYGTSILITQHTFEMVKYEVIARRLDVVQVRGREEPVAIYELLDLLDENGVSVGYEWIAVFEEGLSLYERGCWSEAINQFEETIRLRGEDSPSEHFIERCRKYLTTAEAIANGGEIRALTNS
jgi:adenylate cyclase